MGEVGSSERWSVVDRARRRRRRIERFLARRPAARALLSMPRTAGFVVRTLLRRVRATNPGPPVPTLTPALVAQVALDEAILALAMAPTRFPRRGDYERLSTELRDARALFETHGWLDAPLTYHRRPPPLTDPAFDGGRALGVPYERMLFPSGFAPRPEEPGSQEWAEHAANRTAVATVLRHEGEPRPWVVAIHGFGMGFPFMDLVGLHAVKMHRRLGLNVVLPVLPLHGPRRVTRVSGEQFLSFDLISTLHGLTQAVWDIRRIISWLRAQDAPAIGIYGVSLGGYVASLVAGVEAELGGVIAGIPVADLPTLIHTHSPAHLRLRSTEHAIIGGNAEPVLKVVSPLEFEPNVRFEHRFIFAGLGDRLARPMQAHLLWRHWDEPRIEWYAGNHVGYLWSRQVGAFVVEALERAGLVDAA
jgi:hypothetical protein